MINAPGSMEETLVLSVAALSSVSQTARRRVNQQTGRNRGTTSIPKVTLMEWPPFSEAIAGGLEGAKGLGTLEKLR